MMKKISTTYKIYCLFLTDNKHYEVALSATTDEQARGQYEEWKQKMGNNVQEAKLVKVDFFKDETLVAE
jgi:hypothetical protein